MTRCPGGLEGETAPPGANGRGAGSKHAVAAGGFFRNRLNNIPVLNDLVLRIEAENIDNRPGDARLAAGGRNVQNDIVAVDNHPFNLAVRVGEFLFQKGDELTKAFRPILRARIMLDILLPEVGFCGIKVFIVQRLIIKSDDVFFVL